MPRKKLPKTALPRIYFIDKEIASLKYPNAPTLARQYETSLSSINRDIAYMRDMFHAPIEYDFFKKGFYYTDPAFRLSVGVGTPIYKAALNLLESISAPFKSIDGECFKERKVVIEIDGDAEWIREREWAPDQRIREKAEGIELTFTTNQLQKTLEWILAQGPRAKPIAPKELVEQWKQTVRAMAKRAEE